VDKLKGFRLGCDDYIVKPIDEELLTARIHAILKRSSRHNNDSSEPTQFTIGKFSFTPSTQVLIQGDQKEFLTVKESQLLRLLCEHNNVLLPRKKALRKIWGNNDEFNRKSMDVFVFKLRKYLEKDPTIRIKNVHGKGLILETSN